MDERTKIGRRGVLKSVGLGVVAGSLSAPLAKAQDSLFAHGVASGDPLSDRVVIWTRVTPQGGELPPVRWQVARDVAFKNIVANGQARTTAARDYTVKVDVGGLSPDTRYHYRFLVDETSSPHGRTRTLPVGDVEKMTLAVCSCANYPYGFFNIYREMALNSDIDLVLHLGDYIYEYAPGGYSSPEIEAQGRVVSPAKEIVALDDYRARYRTYRADPDLQAVHAAHPFLLVWDDHELSNDSWKNGAENHQPDQDGAWAARRDAALKAYDEWMPTRADMRRPWRSFDFGTLARIIMLDTRLWGRDKQFDYATDIPPRTFAFDMTDATAPKPIFTPDGRATISAEKIAMIPVPFDLSQNPPAPVFDWAAIKLFDPKNPPANLSYLPDINAFREKLDAQSRTLLGAEQEEWLGPQLQGSRQRGQTWQIVGQQVLMGRIPIPSGVEKLVEGQTSYIADQIRQLGRLARTGLPLNMDAWDGYPAARQRVFDMLRSYAANAVVLAGDTHNSWVSQLADKDGQLGYEFATPSVTSPGFETYVPADPEKVRAAFTQSAETLKWADTQHRGYMTLRFTREAAEVSYHHIDGAKSKRYSMLKPTRFRVAAADKPSETGFEQLS